MIFDSIQQKLIQVYFKGKSFIFSHKKVVIAGVLLLALVFVLLPHFSQAAKAPTSIEVPGGNFLAWVLYMAKMLIYWLTLLAARILAWMLRGTQGFLDSELVTVGWSVVRDTANMFFILILLVIAFGTILRLEALGLTYKRLLTPMIVAILLVNFSRTICTTIVNFCDTLMEGFIGGISGGKIGTLPDALVSGMQLDKMWETAPVKISLWKIFTGFQTLDVILAQAFDSAYASVALIAMLAVCIFLMIRVLALSLLTIAAPLVFVMQIIPATKTYVAKWWPTFIKYALYGPIAAFCVALAGKMSELLRKGGIGLLGWEKLSNVEQQALEKAGFASAISTPRALVEGLFVCGILFAAVLAAQQLGLHGAGAIVKLARGGAGVLFTGAKAGGRFVGRRVSMGLGAGKEGLVGKVMTRVGLGKYADFPRFLSPRVLKEGLKTRIEEAEKMSYEGAYGWVTDRVNALSTKTLGSLGMARIMKRDYESIDLAKARKERRAYFQEVNPHGGHPYLRDEFWKAVEAKDIPGLQELLLELGPRQNWNELLRESAQAPKTEKIGRHMFSKKYKILFGEKYLASEKIQKEMDRTGMLKFDNASRIAMLESLFGKERGIKLGAEISEEGKISGDQSRSEMRDFHAGKEIWTGTVQVNEAKRDAETLSEAALRDKALKAGFTKTDIEGASKLRLAYLVKAVEVGADRDEMIQIALAPDENLDEIYKQKRDTEKLRDVVDQELEAKIMDRVRGHRAAIEHAKQSSRKKLDQSRFTHVIVGYKSDGSEMVFDMTTNARDTAEGGNYVAGDIHEVDRFTSAVTIENQVKPNVKIIRKYTLKKTKKRDPEAAKRSEAYYAQVDYAHEHPEGELKKLARAILEEEKEK